MPAMLDLPDLPASVEVTLQLVLIAVAALAAFVVLRTGVGVSMRHLLDRRSQEARAGVLPPAELERRVQTIGRLVVRIAGSVIAIIAGLMALRLFGIDIGPAVAGLGVVGIAVGLGAQTVVRDWLAGIFIVLENQYSQGDVVRLAGVDGVVEDFSLRRTTLRDMDGAVHTVPNGQIIVTSNVTRVRTAVTVELEVAGEADLDRAAEIVDRIGEDLKADPAWRARIIDAPRVVNVEESGSMAKLTVAGQVRAAEQLAVAEELRARIVAAFADAGIKVPFPHRVVATPATTRDGDDAGAA
jgi:small-conductance mechanosensitive channel